MFPFSPNKKVFFNCVSAMMHKSIWKRESFESSFLIGRGFCRSSALSCPTVLARESQNRRHTLSSLSHILPNLRFFEVRYKEMLFRVPTDAEINIKK